MKKTVKKTARLKKPARSKAKLDRRSAKLEDLFIETQGVKMISIKELMSEKDEDKTGADRIKLSQIALKSIEVQMRILAQSDKGEDAGPMTELKVLWEAMEEVPSLGPIIRRKDVKKKIIEALREKMEDE